MDPEGARRDLLTEVIHARTAFSLARRVHGSPRGDVDAARHRLVMALRAYTSGLDTEGTPVPYRLRNELRLLQGLDPLEPRA